VKAAWRPSGEIAAEPTFARRATRSVNRRALTEEPIFWRERGDETFKPFSRDDYETLRAEFEATERLQMLER
jgi:hypothetical protein